MKTITTTATITTAGTIILQDRLEVEPGEYQIVLVVDEHTRKQDKPQPLVLEPYDVGLRAASPDFPIDAYGPWPANFSFRREELYGDDGR